MSEKVRLQKFMSKAGIASRRASEELIAQGKVKVNGDIITEPGFKVDPETDQVLVNGEPATLEKNTYILLNKPSGYVCTSKDKHAEKTVFDLIPDTVRLHSVGRLDKNTEGLLLLTNDGELTYKLTHPSFNIEKSYLAVIKGNISEDELKKLSNGVYIKEDDGKTLLTSPAAVKLLHRGKRTSTIELTIHEGHKRQVRKMCEAVGHPVVTLKRTREGFLTLEGLASGKWRYLKADEIRKLKNG